MLKAVEVTEDCSAQAQINPLVCIHRGHEGEQHLDYAKDYGSTTSVRALVLGELLATVS